MKTIHAVAGARHRALAGVLAGVCFLAQGSAIAQEKPPSKPTIEQLIEQLGAADYQARKAAEKQLLERGGAAVEALKKSAEKHSDPEVQWRSGRILRRIQDGAHEDRRRTLGPREKSATPPESGGEAEPRPGDRPIRRMRSLFDQLDEVFRDKSFGEGFDGDMKRHLDEVMQQMRESLKGLEFDGGFRFEGGFPQGFGADGSNRSMKLEQGPDGVRLEVTEPGEDGKPKTEVYEADSIDELRRKHPGVLGRGFRFDFGRLPFDGWPREPVAPPQLGTPRRGATTPRRLLRRPDGDRELRRRDRDAEPPVADRSSGRKLGFYAGDVPPAVRDYLALDGGLLVTGIAEGTTAEKIGLLQGDIVVQVGERRIATIPDVARALEEIGDGEVRVQIVRRGRELTLPQKNSK